MITKAMLLIVVYSIIDFGDALPVFNTSMQTVKQIPLPDGYERVPVQENGFGAYLRNLPLRKDKRIYLYNGQLKSNQSLHYAVVDISTGNKDLQQCADAIMRLRAEYFYARQAYDSIIFRKNDHGFYQFTEYARGNGKPARESFMRFMETVFINCGTYSLQEQLKPVKNPKDLQVGDVWIKGGAPGHAEIVVDMAVNRLTGKKLFLLAEGYMPAQDIHILLNPKDASLGPWYELDEAAQLVTATWIFSKNELRRW
ncbi:MAG: DUF4846 domain-containing protein [Bacteroidota bacterium]